jgi:hypothetical protein
MRHSASMVGSVGFVVFVTAAVTVGFDSPARAADDFSGSLVGSLVDMNDMRPLMAVDSTARPAGKLRSTGSPASTRQSVPDRDRASSYRSDEVFGHSKVAVPLLVADLEPQKMGADIRPMSGRSVGARPAAPWTRPLTRALNETAGPTGDSSASWSSYGRR